MKKTKEKKKEKCNYHLCNRVGDFKQCKFCGNYFCEEHINPRIPQTPMFKSKSPETWAYMEEWHKKGGHPCVPYVDYWETHQEEEKQKWGNTLNKLLKKRKRRWSDESNEQDRLGWLWVLLIILAIGGLIYLITTVL